MQHALNVPVTPDQDDSEAEAGRGAHGLQLPARSGLTIVEEDVVLTNLPSRGYRVFNPQISDPARVDSRAFANHAFSFPSTEKAQSSGDLKHRLGKYVRFAARNWSNILLLFVPAGILAPRLGSSDTIVFLLNCIAIVPLADVLCRATDAASSHLGETTGALLNVTMGNATEVLIFHALLQRQYMIVRASLLGSIIVNILLVLGLAIITGELKCPGQRHSVAGTQAATIILCLTTASLLIPSIMKLSGSPVGEVLNLSRGISVALIVAYFIYLYTQMRTPKPTYTPLGQLEPETPTPETFQITEIRRSRSYSYRRGAVSYPGDALRTLPFDEPSPYRPDSPPRSPLFPSFQQTTSKITQLKSNPWFQKLFPPLALFASTFLLSVSSSHLVDTIDHVATHTPLSKTTVGLIVLPLVGNAAELVSGIMFAGRRQMDLAFAVSIGSAIQIALCVTPVMVVVGWAAGREMGLGFGGFEAGVLAGSVVVFGVLVGGRGEGGSGLGWAKGLGLLGGYLGITIASYFVPNLE